MNSFKLGLVGTILVAFCFCAFSAYGRLPEPDNIIYGVAREGTVTVTARHGGEELALFTAAQQPDLSPYYVLRLPIDSLEPQLAGTVRPGDMVDIFVNDETVAAATFAAGEKGELIRIHLTDVDEDGDGMLDAWELAYFGGTDVSDGTGNADGDSFTDLEEFLSDSSPLVLTAVGPRLGVSPSSLGFGSLDIDAGNTTRTLTISNTGDANLVIVSLSLGGGDASDFGLINDLCSGQTIAPGASRTVEVSFDPVFVGEALAQLAIVSNNVRTSPLRLDLSGTGSNDGILYVKDDSYCHGKSPCYSSLGGLGGAYAAAAEGSQIRISAAGTYLEGDLDFNQDIAIFLRGGWDDGYNGNSGSSSTINGSLTISDGTVTIEGIVIEGPAVIVQLDDSSRGFWRIRSWSDLGYGWLR